MTDYTWLSPSTLESGTAPQCFTCGNKSECLVNGFPNCREHLLVHLGRMEKLNGWPIYGDSIRPITSLEEVASSGIKSPKPKARKKGKKQVDSSSRSRALADYM